DARHASMHALLDELAPPQRRWHVAALLVALVTAVAGVAVMQKMSATRRAELCRASGARLRGAWDDARQQAVRATVTGSRGGAEVWPRLQSALDGYATAWVRMHDETCDATERRGEQSVELFDLRMSCLEQRRKELDELTQLLAARPELAAKATQAAGSL